MKSHESHNSDRFLLTRSLPRRSFSRQAFCPARIAALLARAWSPVKADRDRTSACALAEGQVAPCRASITSASSGSSSDALVCVHRWHSLECTSSNIMQCLDTRYPIGDTISNRCTFLGSLLMFPALASRTSRRCHPRSDQTMDLLMRLLRTVANICPESCGMAPLMPTRQVWKLEELV